MATIRYRDRAIELEVGETVLDALLDDGFDVPHSCRSGACQTCMMRCTNGTPPKKPQAGLKPTLIAQGYFLPCVCEPTQDLTVADADDAALTVAAQVVDVSPLSDSVVRLRLNPTQPLAYRSGQYVSLIRPDGLARSYSLASLPDDPWLEMHVRLVPGGQMSQWIGRELQPGDNIGVRGLAGDCFYLDEDLDTPLLLVGTGTGLAPLYGIVRDALRCEHRGRIELYHGARAADGFYLVDELLELEANYSNFGYHRCVLEGGDEPRMKVGDVQQIVRAEQPDLKSWRVYLCGDPNLVKSLRRAVFLAGAPMKQIHADAFIMANQQTTPACRP